VLPVFRCARIQGVPIFFVEIGREANINFGLKEALATAVQRATNAVPLRKHAVYPLTRMSCDEPLFDMICDISEGNRLSVAVLVKGAGSENVSALAMLEPLQDVRPFVCNTIWESGGKPCPPIIMGLGIGSTFDGCARLAKRTLLRSLEEEQSPFEAEILEQKASDRWALAATQLRCAFSSKRPRVTPPCFL